MRFFVKTEWSDVVNKAFRKRGYNKLITVYKQLPLGSFTPIGEEWINTASYRGDDAIACQILHDNLGYKWGDTGTHYYLKRKDIRLLWLP